MKRDMSSGEGTGPAETRMGGQEMSQRVEAVLSAGGLRGPAVSSLEGASGLFVLTEEQLLFHDGHGTRRVTLRDLARIHSDAEGTLRVETPAGVAMSASLIGFDGDEVQRFFGQVRDVTARVKSLTPPPLVTPAPRPSEPSSRTQPVRPVEPAARPQDPEEGVSVTAVRRREGEGQQAGPPPKITVNRGGRREDLSGGGNAMRENGLGLIGTGSGLERDLPPAGSVEIRAVRKGGAERPTSSLTAPTATELGGYVDQQTVISTLPQEAHVQQESSNDSGAEYAYPEHGQHVEQPQPSVQPAPAPSQATARPPEPVKEYTEADLHSQAHKVRGVPGRLQTLGIVLIVGAIITAILMFANAQRLLALWVLIAGVVGLVALLSAAELAKLQAIQADVLAKRSDTSPEAAGRMSGSVGQEPPAHEDDFVHAEAAPERHE